MKMKYPLLVLVGVVGLGWASGCATVDSREGRIAAKRAVFAAADEATQTNVRKGIVLPGYSAELVYMAMGEPEHGKFPAVAKAGGPRRIVWAYQRAADGDYAVGASEGFRYEAKLDKHGMPPAKTTIDETRARVPELREEPRMRTAQAWRTIYVIFENDVVAEIATR